MFAQLKCKRRVENASQCKSISRQTNAKRYLALAQSTTTIMMAISLSTRCHCRHYFVSKTLAALAEVLDAASICRWRQIQEMMLWFRLDFVRKCNDSSKRANGAGGNEGAPKQKKLLKTQRTYQRVRTCRVQESWSLGVLLPAAESWVREPVSRETCRVVKGNTLANCYCQCLNYFALSLPFA